MLAAQPAHAAPPRPGVTSEEVGAISQKLSLSSREVTKLFGINWEAAFQIDEFMFGLATGRPFSSNGTLPFSRFADQNGVSAPHSATTPRILRT